MSTHKSTHFPLLPPPHVCLLTSFPPPARQQRRSSVLSQTLSRAPLGTPITSDRLQAQNKIQILSRKSQVQLPELAAEAAGKAVGRAEAVEGAGRRDSAIAREIEGEAEGEMAARARKYEMDAGFANVFAEPSGSGNMTRRGRVLDIQETPYSSSPVSLEDYMVSKPSKRDAAHSKAAASVSISQPLATLQTPDQNIADEATEAVLESELSSSPTHHDTFTFPTPTGQPELPSTGTDAKDPPTSTVRKITHPNGDISTVELSPSGKRWIELGKVTASSTSTSPERERYPRTQQYEQTVAPSQPVNTVSAYARRPTHLVHRNSEDDIRTFQNAWATATARNSSSTNLRRTVMHDPLSTTSATTSAQRTAYAAAAGQDKMDGPRRSTIRVEGPFAYQHEMASAPARTATSGSQLPASAADARTELYGNPWASKDPTATAPAPARPAYPRAPSNLLLPGQRPQFQPSSISDDELRAYVPSGSHVSQDKIYFKAAGAPKAADLKTFWNSGRVNQARQQEFSDHHLAASGKTADDSAQAAMSVFVPMYENLLWYASQKSTLTDPRAQASRTAIGAYSASATQPGAAVRGKDYFARFGEPPEWCIDRSMTLGQSTLGIGKAGAAGQKVQSFFGEPEWTKAPERVGRDIRYRPLPSMSGSELRKGPKMSGGIDLPGIGGRKEAGLGMSLGRFG